MSLKIYLARHGQDEDNAAGILNGRRNQPLTALGLQQAETLTKSIQQTNLKFQAVYTSPLQRAHDTALTIATTLNQNSKSAALPIVMDDLIERNFGIMTGKPTKSIPDTCKPNILQSDTICYFLCPDGAETFPQLMERGKRIIQQIQSLHQDDDDDDEVEEKKKDCNVLLVAHGDIGKMIYASYYNLDWKDVLMQFHFGNSDLLLLSKCSKAENAHVFKFQQHNH